MSEDVTRFLSQIKELGERRIEEDEARSRELEEKILQDRKERQARRRERARSISPLKSSPINTPTPSTQTTESHRLERLDLVSSPILIPPASDPPPRVGDDDMASAASSLLTSPSKRNESSLEADTELDPSSPSRNGSVPRGLSWQRRPNSQTSERSRTRPLSVFAAENAARSSNSALDQEPSASESLSRDQISSAMSSKEPSWIRQTADRGTSSVGYRRSQVEDSQNVDLSLAQTEPPSMARDLSGEPPRNADVSLPGFSVPTSTVATHSSLFNGPKLDPPESLLQPDVESSPETRGSPDRTSPAKAEWPISPTKGVGGFVQSAMLKRSESVNKRWSVQSPTTLHRADPIAPTRTGFDPSHRKSISLSTKPIRPGSRDGQEEPRPQSITSASPRLDTDATVLPEPPSLDFDTSSLPVSPSKTMDPRRWSPQKSSWLESALNKPESPKPKPSQPASNQPAWMAELQKAKAQKAAHPGTEGNKPSVVSHKHTVSIGGLMRSSAPGVNATPVGMSSLHGQSHSLSGVGAFIPLINSEESKPPTLPSLVKPKSDTSGDGRLTPSLSSVGSIKATTPPKTDFRASLKPSAPAVNTATSTTQKAEFKNMFGTLRKTTTQNYVAPDEFKNNITRGKAALSVTGGPQKSERVDEFKEAILAKKKEFQAANPDGWKMPRPSSTTSEQVIPESILKRAELGRSNTVKRETTSSSALGTATADPRRRSTMYLKESASSSTPSATEPRKRSTTISQRGSASGSLAEKLELFSNLEKRNSVIAPPNTKPEDHGLKAEAPHLISRSTSTDRVNKSNSPPHFSRLGSVSTDRVNEFNISPSRPRPVSMISDHANEFTVSPSRSRPVSMISDHANEFTVSPSRPRPASMLSDHVNETDSSLHSSRPTSTSTDRVNETIGSLRLSRPVSMSADRVNETDIPPRTPGKIGGSALANRFNPALGNLLARGPPPAASSSGITTGKTDPSGFSSVTRAEGNDNESGSGPKLTHMTKNRARGPKRKAPTMASSSFTTDRDVNPSSSEISLESEPDTRQITQVTLSRPDTISLVDSSKESTSPARLRPRPLSLMGTSKLVTEFPSAAEVLPSPSESGSRIHAQVAAFAAQGRQSIVKKITGESQPTTPLTPSPGKLNMSRMSRFMDVTPTAERGREEERPKKLESPVKARDMFERRSPSPLEMLPRSESRSPLFSKTKAPWHSPGQLTPKQQPTDETESIFNDSDNKGLTQTTSRLPPRSSVMEPFASLAVRPLPEAPMRALPESPVRPLPEAPVRLHSSREVKSSNTAVSPMHSPTKQSPDTSVALRDFFGSDRPGRKYNVDVAELLMQHPSVAPSKIWSLSAQFFVIAGGRKQVVPAHHEGTLFEREIYLCTHSFKNEVGRTTAEVYFWVGDDVPESALESATALATQEARSFGGTLIKMKQGKETPSFLQALGGIVITHRGSANTYDSLAPRMLCGRHYQGHVVFDEVDFSPASLCSGFPYLVTQGGRCYLWKGKGSSIDELGCARLIGTDYALSGEMEEVEEGQEPSAFWDLFNGGNRFGSADHWRLKPNYDKYRCRLFLSDAVSKQQIVELFTFSQADLLPTNIYVVDAFFELYIVVGARAQSQYASFHNALDFAQEYAILAASIEDRPFVPVSTVVLEGIPRDMKSVFRKWQDALSPTITNANVGLKRGRSLKIVPLSQALQALSN